MGVKVIRIYELDGIVNARLELVGGFFEVEVPAGPVAGGYINKRLSFEQFAALLSSSYVALSLSSAQGFAAASDVSPNTLYGITGDWNVTGTDSTVYVHGVRTDAFHNLGLVYDAQGASQLVEVDVAAGRYVALGQLTADQLAALQVAGASAINQFVLSTELNSLTSRLYGLSDLLTLLQRYIIRWDQEKTVTLNQDFEGRLRYTSGQAFAFTSGTYAAGIIRLSADDYGRRGDLAGVRIMVGSKDLVFEAGAAEAFHSSGGPRTLPALAGYQYIFHLVRPDPNSTVGSYWVVHTMPSTPTSGGAAPGVATPAGTVLVFTQDAEYAPIYNGTFTVDPAGAKVGVTVFVELGAAATAPTLDPTVFERNGSRTFQPGERNEYGFRVARSGKIHYVISPLA